MGTLVPGSAETRAGEPSPRGFKRAFQRPTTRAPTWLVIVVAVLAFLGFIEEVSSGPRIFSAVAAIAAVGIHLSWPIVLRMPLAGSVLAVCAAVPTVVMMERVGVATMTLMIVVLATCALAPLWGAVATLLAVTGWAWWVTIYFGDTAALFWGLELLFLISAAVGAFVRVVVLDLLSARRRVRQMERHAERVRREERLAIARELHDVVAHELTLMSLQSARFRRSKDPQVMHRALVQINENSRAALAELRALLGVLRWEEDSATRIRGGLSAGAMELPQTLERLIERTREAGFDVVSDLQLTGWRDLASSSREATVRIVQEALANVTKHAKDRTICSVEVHIVGSSVQILVTSKRARRVSRIRDSTLGSQQGLIGIRERAQVLGGSASAGPEHGSWVVRAVLPAFPAPGH